MSPEIYDDDFNYAVNIVRTILWSIGAWPVPVSSSTPMKIVYRIQKVITYFLFLVTVVPPLMYTFLKVKSRRTQLKLIGPICNSSMQFVKYSILLYRAEDIRKSIGMIDKDWLSSSKEEREILRSKAQLGRRLVWTSVFFMYGGGMCYRTIVPFLRGKIVTAENVTIRPLACPSYYILFNEQATPFYEIIFALQFFAGLVSYAVTSGACGVSAFFVLHACSQLRILINKMKELAEGKDLNEKNVQRKLADIVEHQTKTKGFLKYIQSITEYITFIEILGGIFLTCFTGFYIIMEWESSNAIGLMTYILLLTSFIFCIFIYCYIGQQLNNESNNVGRTSITIDWYRLPVRTARCLTLVIVVSNHTMKLVAGKMIDVSLATFTDIMKLSVGYLNILRTVE